jgi:hypothetical integral membrane protein (TIGR02206 family)
MSTLIGALVAIALCAGARRRPGPWTEVAAKTLAVVLVGEQISWQIQFIIHHDWSRFNSLPFDLCDFTCFVAAVACWTLHPLFVELTWFWGLAGTLQAIITPDQFTPFPHLSFDNYVVEHLGIVVAAVYLVIGLRIYPRPGAVTRVFLISLVYAGLCGILDAATGGDYLYLRYPPPSTSLLNLLGPWPWYIASSAVIALALFMLLDLPFRSHHSRDARQITGEGHRSRTDPTSRDERYKLIDETREQVPGAPNGGGR